MSVLFPMNIHRCGALLLLFAISGCGPEIREYQVPVAQEDYLPSDLLRDAFDVIPFRWDVPSEWAEAENDQFSAFAWETATSGEKARITVSPLSEGAGLEQQFVRWRGQIGLPPVDPSEAMKDVQSLVLDGCTGEYVEYKGESETILGMIVPFKGKLWIFKLRAANAAAEKNKAPFRTFCESLKVVS
jgi:hypothetical protein